MTVYALTDENLAEMKRLKAHFPFRKVSGVKDPDGTFTAYANSTYAQANNHARKTGGTLYRIQ